MTGTGRTPEEQTFIVLVPMLQYYRDTELLTNTNTDP